MLRDDQDDISDDKGNGDDADATTERRKTLLLPDDRDDVDKGDNLHAIEERGKL